jgi:hypothetical protein
LECSVASEHVGFVLLFTGTAGVAGCAFTTIFDETNEVHPAFVYREV